jgi:PAS domain S-box-containing protein
MTTEDRYRTLIEKHPYGIHENDADGIITFGNPAYHRIFGYAEGETAVGTTIWDTLPTEEQREELRHYLAYLVKEQPQPTPYEQRTMTVDGRPIDIQVDWDYKRDEQGQVVGFISVTTDVTAQKEAEAERVRLQQEVIEAQKRLIQELSTPVIPVMDRIIVMPLIGSIDTLRAKDITRALLAGIREHRAKVVILDITGVPIVDSGVADHLNKTVQAARLKGARAIVTGISDAVAETIVDLGIDWGGIDTLSDTQTGLIAALNSLGFALMRKREETRNT